MRWIVDCTLPPGRNHAKTKAPGAQGRIRARVHMRALAMMLAAILFAAVSAASQPPSTAEQRYQLESPAAAASALDVRFTPAQIGILEALNRADAMNLPKLKQLVVPDTWHDDLLAYSPFPHRLVTWGSDAPRLLIVHQPSQAFAAYEHGRLVRWGPVSSGRAISPTPHGRFHLNWRSTGRHSTVNPRWFMPWYFNFHNRRGLSLHEYVLPGRPASHACIRLLERDARWLYDWGRTWTLDARGWTVVEPGTPVQIIGCYAFGSAPPWRSREWLGEGIALPITPSMDQQSCPRVAQTSPPPGVPQDVTHSPFSSKSTSSHRHSVQRRLARAFARLAGLAADPAMLVTTGVPLALRGTHPTGRAAHMHQLTKQCDRRWHHDCLIADMAKHDKHKQPGKTDPRPRPQDEHGDDIPDTPPNEPQPEPIRDPKPPGRPKGPYVA